MKRKRWEMKRRHWYGLWALYGSVMFLWTWIYIDASEIYISGIALFIIIALVMTLPNEEEQLSTAACELAKLSALVHSQIWLVICVGSLIDYGKVALVHSQICASSLIDIGYRPRGYWAAADALYLPILNTPTVSVITSRPLFGYAYIGTKQCLTDSDQ